MKDNPVNDCEKPKGQDIKMAKGQVPVFWSGQPTANELTSMVSQLEDEGYEVKIRITLTSLTYNPTFLRPKGRRLEKEELLATSIFSFSHNVFYPIKNRCQNRRHV